MSEVCGFAFFANFFGVAVFANFFAVLRFLPIFLRFCSFACSLRFLFLAKIDRVFFGFGPFLVAVLRFS